MKDQINGRDKIQKLQQGIANSLIRSASRNAFAVITIFAMGVVSGMILLAGIKAHTKAPPRLATIQADCGGCHSPNLDSYKKYRKYHQARVRPVAWKQS
jgi:nitrate/TMAO reductase-like tetraheme cytochrome c subunit